MFSIKAPLFGNNLDLENPGNAHRALEIKKQLEFYDVLSWEAKEVCDECTQKACQDFDLKKPRNTSFLSYRETRCAYAQAFIAGEQPTLALFESIQDRIATERAAHPDLFQTTKMETCCKRDEYKFCESHLEEYKEQAVLRICKESGFLPATYEQLTGYLLTATDKIIPLMQKKFDEIHLILRIANPSRTAKAPLIKIPARVPLQISDDLVWLEQPKKACLTAVEAEALHDRNGGLDLCDEFTALVLWANHASGKKIDEMSNQDLMKNFLRIIKGEKEETVATKP